MKKKTVIGVLGVLAATASLLYAQGHVNPGRHPNLAAAQRSCADAMQKITAAQQANVWDMNGHAKKAKELLTEASEEIKQAALAANANGH